MDRPTDTHTHSPDRQGLGGTLVLLSVFKKALPALPLSIFLGVCFYLLTRVVIMPYLDQLLRAPLYV